MDRDMVRADVSRNKRLYKSLLVILKVVPVILAICELLNTVLSFFDIKCTALSFIGGVSFLPLLFFYVASYAFQFCEYHRMFLHYIFATNILNVYDFFIGIPVSSKVLFGIHCTLICVTLLLILYFYRRERCCKR